MILDPNKWVQLYGDYLYSIAMLKTHTKETAEDLVHETFISGLKAQKKFRGDSSEKTWLTSILNNKIIDYYRKKDVQKRAQEELWHADEQFYSNFFQKDRYNDQHWKSGSTPGKWTELPDENVERLDFYRVLEACLEKLPSKLKPVFIAKYLEDKKTEEVCKEYELTSSNYWVIVHRAKLVMRSCMEKNWIED